MAVKKRSPIRRRKKAKQVKQTKPTDWLSASTGHDGKWWVAKIQALITKHSRPTRDPWHGTTKTAHMVADLVREIEKVSPKKVRYEVNMHMASVLSLALATWYLRVHRAKSYDPRRPVKLRKAAYFQRLGYAAALFLAMEDESQDQEHFPGQNWETPFDPCPTDGYFV